MLLVLLLLPALARADWGYPPSTGVTLSDPTATQSSPKTLRLVDQDTDAADEFYALGAAIMMPGATPTQVSAAAPFPVYLPAAFPGPVNLTQVGGSAYSLGTALMLASIPVTLATDDTVMAAIDVLLTAIEVDTSAIASSVASIDGHLPQLKLDSQVPTSSLSVVQDSTGAWTVVEASAAGILTDTSALAGTVSGSELQVDVVAALPAGANNIGDVDVATLPALVAGSATIGAVDVQLDGTDVDGDQGVPSAGTLRTVETQPDAATNSGLTAADQSEAAPDIAANASRHNLLVQSSGTTTCLVSVEDTTGGTNGVIVAGGTADDDGTGGTFTTTSTDAVYIYDLSGSNTCKYRYIEETQ